MEFEQRMISCLRRNLWQTQNREFTQELRLGDELPDIGSVLAARGQWVMRGKEWAGDSVGISGGVMVWVLYAPADGAGPRCVETWIPVQGKWPMSDSQREGTIRASMQLRNVEARCVSARKLMIRADLSLLAEALEPWETETYVPTGAEPDVQMLRNSYLAMLPKETGEKNFQMEEELELPTAPERICALSVHWAVGEQKVLGDKAVFRGDALVHVLYEDAQGQLRTMDQALPFSQFAELDNDYGKDASLCVMMALTGLEPELAEGRLLLKCGVVAQYVVWAQELLEMVEDAYSLTRQITPVMDGAMVPMELDRCRNTMGCRVQMPAEVRTVVDLWSGAEQPRVRRAGGLAELELTGSMGALYMDSEGQLRSCTGQWSQLWELPVSEDAAVLAQIVEISPPEAKIGEDLTLEMDVTGQVLTVPQQRMPMVKGLELGEKISSDGNRPSVILRKAGTASLWELAKTNGSTVDAIRCANGLEQDPPEDKMLLIPVCG